MKRMVARAYIRKVRKTISGLIPKEYFKKFVILAGVIFFLLTFGRGDFGFVRIYKLKHKKQNLQLQYKQLQAEVLHLARDKELLQEDFFYLEKIAREKYGLSRPDEKVYRFLPAPESAQAQP